MEQTGYLTIAYTGPGAVDGVRDNIAFIYDEDKPGSWIRHVCFEDLCRAIGMTEAETKRRRHELEDSNKPYRDGCVFRTGKDGFDHYLRPEHLNLWLCRLMRDALPKIRQDKLRFYQLNFFLGAMAAIEMVSKRGVTVRAPEQMPLAADGQIDLWPDTSAPHINRMRVRPVSSEPPKIGLREAISKVLRSYCHRHRYNHEKAWHDLYRYFKYSMKIDLSQRAENQGKHRLDIAEALGVMPQLHDAALYLFSD